MEQNQFQAARYEQKPLEKPVSLELVVTFLCEAKLILATSNTVLRLVPELYFVLSDLDSDGFQALRPGLPARPAICRSHNLLRIRDPQLREDPSRHQRQQNRKFL